MERLERREHDAWDAFVDATDGGTVFHTAWWHRAWGAPVEVYARRDAGEFEAGIAVSTGRYLGVTAVRRPPFTPANGPVFSVPDLSERGSAYSKLVAEWNDAMSACPRAGIYDFVVRPGSPPALPLLWNGYRASPTYTYVIPAVDEGEWPARMSSMNRRNLRKAHAEADERRLAVETGTPMIEVVDLFLQTARDKGFAIRGGSDRLVAWWSEVASREAGTIYTVRDEHTMPACSTLVVRDRRTAYYLAGGMRSDVRSESRLNLVLFERMINDAHALGLDFDFEGSSLPGVERFFRGWGGELREGMRYVRIPALHAYIAWQAHRYMRRGHHTGEWVSLP
ncbi:MAG: GNAT family N-acetyltransferase [Candidatus Eisenbacteria bacterium]|nr:GNAT family N-acetyltransferase [Candidatus Eisenbacteria bacterium]